MACVGPGEEDGLQGNVPWKEVVSVVKDVF